MSIEGKGAVARAGAPRRAEELLHIQRQGINRRARFLPTLDRAAEQAAPSAKQIFWNAIGAMSFDDARTILNGGDTAATEYFKAKTSGQLAAAFRTNPAARVTSLLQEVFPQ